MMLIDQEDLVSRKNKKHNVVARFNGETEYKVMVVNTRELLWVKQLLQELRIENNKLMKLYCDN